MLYSGNMRKEKIVTPGCGNHLSDQQVAALANYAGQQFGGGNCKLTPDAVKKLRGASLH